MTLFEGKQRYFPRKWTAVTSPSHGYFWFINRVPTNVKRIFAIKRSSNIILLMHRSLKMLWFLQLWWRCTATGQMKSHETFTFGFYKEPNHSKLWKYKIWISDTPKKKPYHRHGKNWFFILYSYYLDISSLVLASLSLKNQVIGFNLFLRKLKNDEWAFD